MAKKKSKKSSVNLSTTALTSDLADMSTNNTAWMMNYNASEAAKSRNWSEYMSNTSHQREVADLQAAGLNPALSLNGGAASYTANSANSGVDSAVSAIANLESTRINSAAQIAMNEATNKANIKMAQLGYKGAKTSAAATRAAAASSAAGMTNAAAINSAATHYASDQAYNSAKYTADHQKTGTIERAGNYIKNKGIGGVLDDFANWLSK